MHDVTSLCTWLTEGVPGASNPAETVAGLSEGLVEAGVPLARVEAFVRTLHPHIAGRSFQWMPGRGVEVVERSYGYLNSPEFAQGPVGAVFRTGQALRLTPEREPALDALAKAGFTDFYAGPLRFMSGQVHAITFATREPNGFTGAQLAAIERVLAPLARVAEIFALTRTAANLLNTYVGHGAGERILGGRIVRGDTELLRAVIWFSDLRGFTSMSSQLDPHAIIETLNQLFDCQVSAIERRGGEVLKFIGDGLLAILPLDGSAPTARCDQALDAAYDAFTALDALNARRSSEGRSPIRFGLALHVGEVAFGNIGGAGRLDFTCIGPAVNLAARLEGLTGKLQRDIVLSDDFAQLTSRPLESLGEFELKGVPGKQRAHAPRR